MNSSQFLTRNTNNSTISNHPACIINSALEFFDCDFQIQANNNPNGQVEPVYHQMVDEHHLHSDQQTNSSLLANVRSLGHTKQRNIQKKVKEANEPNLDNQIDSAPPPRKIYTDDIPVLDCFSGAYGFDLYHPLCEDLFEMCETKPSTAFFYFKDESGWINLYSKKAPTWWNLSYWCQTQPPEDSFIRIVPAYGTSDKQQEVIQRCFEDFTSTKCSGLGRYSVVKVGHSQAEYLYDKATNRLCVTLPYERPKEGCEYSQFNGKFMCFNSCLYNGGQGNKKPLYLIITLEKPLKNSVSSDSCEVLGRQCIKFRSCACPKRDKDNSERNKLLSSDNPSNGSVNLSAVSLANCTSNSRKRKRITPNGSIGDRGKRHRLMKEMPNEVDCLSNSDIEMNQDVNSVSFSINGEPFQFIAVPLKIPGALSVIKQMRTTLMNLSQLNAMEKESNYYMDHQPLTGAEDLFSHDISQKRITQAESQATVLLRDFYQTASRLDDSKRFQNSSSTDSSSSLQTNLTGILSNSTPNTNGQIKAKNDPNMGQSNILDGSPSALKGYPDIHFPRVFNQNNIHSPSNYSMTSNTTASSNSIESNLNGAYRVSNSDISSALSLMNQQYLFDNVYSTINNNGQDLMYSGGEQSGIFDYTVNSGGGQELINTTPYSKDIRNGSENFSMSPSDSLTEKRNKTDRTR